MAVPRIDTRDPVVLPLQLIHIADGLAVESHLNPSGFMQRLGIQESQLRRAVAHDELLPVLGQRPTLALVMEFPLHLEAREVVDETHLSLPGEADEVVAPIDDALTEILRRNVDLLH